MATVYINDQPVDIGEEKLNLIQATLKIGVFIPYYCWHPALTVVASCPVEKSGQKEFDFEYGEGFAHHIEAFDPTLILAFLSVIENHRGKPSW